MAELQIFKNDEFGEVRAATIDHKPYFCGNDVARALGYANTFDALTKHCEEDGIASCEVIDTLGRKQFFPLRISKELIIYGSISR